MVRMAKAWIFVVAASLAACSSSSAPAPATSSGSTGTKTGTGTGTGNGTGTGKEGKNCDTSLALSSKNPTYEDDVKDVIDKSCASSSCHAAGGQEPILTDYAKVKKVSERVAGSVADQSMPPRDSLEEAESALIAKWADQGFREDEDDEIKSGTAQDSSDCD